MPAAAPARRFSQLLAALAVSLLASSPASALQITAQLVDLDDGLGPGGDYWEGQYTFSDHVFAADEGVTLYFDVFFYSDLTDPEPGVHAADWDVLPPIQPDELLPADGFYDALAVNPGADTSLPFLVRFVWLGGPAKPGAQDFDLSEFDGSAFVRLIETGVTSVPEPSSAALLLAGLIGGVVGVRRR